MSFEDSFLNFCLSCDGSVTSDNEHTPYCSQACRLADLEKSSLPNTLNSPMYEQPASSFSSTSSLSRSFPPASSGFHLPPAIDFTAYRRNSTSEPPSRAEPTRSLSVGSVASAPLHSPQFMTTRPQSSNISAEAKAELRRYESLFDQTRRHGNRSSWS